MVTQLRTFRGTTCRIQVDLITGTDVSVRGPYSFIEIPFVPLLRFQEAIVRLLERRFQLLNVVVALLLPQFPDSTFVVLQRKSRRRP